MSPHDLACDLTQDDLSLGHPRLDMDEPMIPSREHRTQPDRRHTTKGQTLPVAMGRNTGGVTGAIKSHSFIIALNINKLSFSAQRWKSLVMRHMTKNCELDSKSEYLTPFSHSDHHHGSRGPLHESRKLSTIGPTESTFASADSRSDSLNM